MKFRLRLFGQYQFSSVDGTPLKLPSRKCDAVLAILATVGEQGLSREKLISLLWPEKTESQARASLRQCLSALRRLTADNSEAVVKTSSDYLLLNYSIVESDIELLTELLPPVTKDLNLDAIFDLVKGEFLSDFYLKEESFEQWLNETRRQYQGILMSALKKALQNYEQSKDTRNAILTAEFILLHDSLYEPAYQVLIKLANEQGEKSEAIKYYLRCKEALSEELGVSPGQQTEQLYRTVISNVESRDSSALTDILQPLSIAVLPIATFSTDDDKSYLAEGIVDGLITNLSRFRYLRVVAKGSSVVYGESGLTIGEIGRKLGVAYVISGTMRSSGDSLRISVQLVDVKSTVTIWADRFDFSLKDIFEIEDNITRRVASALTISIDKQRFRESHTKDIENIEAYDFWLRGLRELQKGSIEHDEIARELFKQALSVSPDYSRAYTGIAISYFNEWSCQMWERWESAQKHAHENAITALKLDEGDHLNHVILGKIYLYSRRFALAEKHFDQSLMLNHSDVFTLFNITLGYMFLGRIKDAIAIGKQAMQLHPLREDWCTLVVSISYFMDGNFEKSMELARQATTLPFVDGHAYMASILGHLGEIDSARDHYEKFLQEFSRVIYRNNHPENSIVLDWLLCVNPFKQRKHFELFISGLNKAGVDFGNIPEQDPYANLDTQFVVPSWY